MPPKIWNYKSHFFLMLVACLIFSSVTVGDEVKIKRDEGSLLLVDFISACPDVAGSTPSNRVHKGIPGQVVMIKGSPYEIRFFSFEDPAGKISPDMTFQEYIKANDLLEMKSASVTILPGIQFESFDFHRSPVKDGVYFSMAVRKLPEK